MFFFCLSFFALPTHSSGVKGNAAELRLRENGSTGPVCLTLIPGSVTGPAGREGDLNRIEKHHNDPTSAFTALTSRFPLVGMCEFLGKDTQDWRLCVGQVKLQCLITVLYGPFAPHENPAYVMMRHPILSYR